MNNIKTPNYIIQLARDLRNNMTVAEKMLWDRLRRKQICGLKFRSQHPIFRYILDFYCHEKKMAIELDGDIHKQKVKSDEYRDEFLQSLGIKTVRIRNKEVLTDINSVLQKIKDEIA